MLILPRPSLSARPNLRHPLCRGLRLFTFLGSGTSAVNLAGPHLGAPANAPVAIAGVQGPVMRYTKASNMRTDFTPNGLATGGDVTAIVCAKTALAGGSTFNTLLGCWDETAGFKGWLLHSLDSGGIIGIRMIVGDGGTVGGNLFATGATDYADGNYHVFAGSYGRASAEVRVYQDGRRRNQEGSLAATANIATTAASVGVGGCNLHSTLASDSDVAWAAVFDRQLTDQEIYQWSQGPWAAFADDEPIDGATLSPPSIYSEHFRRAENNLVPDLWDWPVIAPTTGWGPWIPSPSPFTRNRLAGRIVPRVPIRLQTYQSQPGGQSGVMTGQSGDMGGSRQAPEKIDPRSVRFTEIVQEILNSLIAGGWIYKAGSSDWGFAFMPRQVTGANSFPGELFLDTATNKISFKSDSGVVRPLE